MGERWPTRRRFAFYGETDEPEKIAELIRAGQIHMPAVKEGDILTVPNESGAMVEACIIHVNDDGTFDAEALAEADRDPR